MHTDPLENAIVLIKQGKVADAQNLLRDLLSRDPHNLPAWSWYVKTYAQDEQRIKALTLCLKYNPDNNEAKQALEKLKRISPTQYQRTGKAISFLYLLGISALLALPIGIPGVLLMPLVYYLASIISSDVLRLIVLIMLFLGTLGLQYGLMLPVTALVSYVYLRLSHSIELYEFRPAIRIGIPLVLNIIAASSLFIISNGVNYQQEVTFHSLVITTVEEKITQNRSNNYVYHATLHIKNNSEIEFHETLSFNIGAFDATDNPARHSEIEPHFMGFDDLEVLIPPRGESNVVVELPIFNIKYPPLRCGNKDLERPISLVVYIFDRDPKFLPVSNNIASQLQQLACGSRQ